jgi:hypothetical protein
MTHSVTHTAGGGGEGASSVRRTLHHRGDRGYYGGHQVVCHILDIQALIRASLLRILKGRFIYWYEYKENISY